MNASRGTAFAELELLVTFGVLASGFAPTPVLMALFGGIRTPEEGVYLTGVVSVFDPAVDDPEDENDEVAAGPELPEDVLA